MKSCLKASPPITPDLSAAPSPGGSGRTSPSSSSSSVGAGHPGMHRPVEMRKAVSFCEEELEEVFFADEWDRSPVPVTPRLSYQDVLELKQLRLSLPRTPPSPTARSPFTTSSPSAYADPPPSSSTTPPAFPVSRFASQRSFTPDRWKNRRQELPPDLDPDILPYLDAVPIRLLPLLDTPQSSPTSPPSPPSQEHTSSPPPAPTPQVQVQPADTTTPPVHPPPPQRTPNFSFLPLLPLQEPAALPPARPPAPHVSKRFNMTFLPLGVEPSAPAPPNPLPEPEPLHNPPRSHSPPASATPSVCSASDTETDTDTESDAPSTVASSLPSPPCDDEHEHGQPQDADRGYFNVPAGSYFTPRVPSADPGQTPPLSAIYPTSPETAAPSTVHASLKTHALRALPSPVLAPPSPFTLNPPSPSSERPTHGGPLIGLGVQMQMQCDRERERPVMTKRMFTAVRTSLQASVSAGAAEQWTGLEAGDEAETEEDKDTLRPSLSRREPAPQIVGQEGGA